MPATQVDITVPEQILSDWAKRCPDFFRREFFQCSVASFAVRIATRVESSAIVFVNSATEVCRLVSPLQDFPVPGCGPAGSW